MAESLIKHKHLRVRALSLDEVAPLGPFPRAPLLALRRYRYFLKEQHELVAGIKAFGCLSKQIMELDKWLMSLELEFRRYAEDEIGPAELCEFIEDELANSEFFIRGGAMRRDVEGDEVFLDALEDLAERIWEKTTEQLPYLGDALTSASESVGLLRPRWQVQFEKDLHEAASPA